MQKLTRQQRVLNFSATGVARLPGNNLKYCSLKHNKSPQALRLRQANGVQAYLVTLALFFLGWRTGVFSPARVYELFGEILSALNLFSLAFCCFLYVKARLAFLSL